MVIMAVYSGTRTEIYVRTEPKVWQETEKLFKGTCRYAMAARGLGRGYKTTGLGRDINTCGGQNVTCVMPAQVVHTIISLLLAVKTHSVLVTNTNRLMLGCRAC
jgi:hypothetical protein